METKQTSIETKKADSKVARAWLIRAVRKLAWKVIRMTAEQRPTCIADGTPRRKKANKANVALTFSE
jgi:hypothetical protein